MTENKFIVAKADQYNVDGVGSLFRFNSPDGRTIHADVYRELSKNVVPVLRALARAVGVPSSSRMRKAELLQAIAPRIYFE
jgi:hypothetical protein